MPYRPESSIRNRNRSLTAGRAGPITCVGLVAAAFALLAPRGDEAGLATAAAQPASPHVALATRDSAPGMPPAMLRAVAAAGMPAPQVLPAWTFDTAPDLWLHALGLIQAGGRRQLLEAKAAIEVCLGVSENAAKLAAFISGTDADASGPLTPDRQVAAMQLMRRCDGFIRVGPDRTGELLDEAVEALKAQGVGSAMALADERGVAARLEEGAGPDVGDALQRTLRSWQRKHAAGDDDPRTADFALALSLAVCDLGRDCSVNGIPALTACLVDGRCGMGLKEDWRSGLRAESVAAVSQYREQIVQAVHQRNLGFFGLAG